MSLHVVYVFFYYINYDDNNPLFYIAFLRNYIQLRQLHTVTTPVRSLILSNLSVSLPSQLYRSLHIVIIPPAFESRIVGLNVISRAELIAFRYLIFHSISSKANLHSSKPSPIPHADMSPSYTIRDSRISSLLSRYTPPRAIFHRQTSPHRPSIHRPSGSILFQPSQVQTVCTEPRERMIRPSFVPFTVP